MVGGGVVVSIAGSASCLGVGGEGAAAGFFAPAPSVVENKMIKFR